MPTPGGKRSLTLRLLSTGAHSRRWRHDGMVSHANARVWIARYMGMVDAMNHLVIGLLLAVTGSVALNASYLIQHAGSLRTPAIEVRHPLQTLRSLLRSRLWLVGGALGLAGWAISIAALTQAP